jgi:hypothetical protein
MTQVFRLKEPYMKKLRSQFSTNQILKDEMRKKINYMKGTKIKK